MSIWKRVPYHIRNEVEVRGRVYFGYYKGVEVGRFELCLTTLSPPFNLGKVAQ